MEFNFCFLKIELQIEKISPALLMFPWVTSVILKWGNSYYYNFSKTKKSEATTVKVLKNFSPVMGLLFLWCFTHQMINASYIHFEHPYPISFKAEYVHSRDYIHECGQRKMFLQNC
jgi:hypothetical protein